MGGRAIGLVALVGISHLGLGQFEARRADVFIPTRLLGTNWNTPSALDQNERAAESRLGVQLLILSARRDLRGVKSDAIGRSSINFGPLKAQRVSASSRILD